MSGGAATARARLSAAAERYRHLLEGCRTRAGETVLSEAYALGRELLAARAGLLDVVTMHHRALAATVAPAGAGMEAAGQVLCELLAGYEMQLRGRDDALAALNGINQRLETQTEQIAQALHDEAGQILAAVMIALDQMLIHADEPPRTVELRRVRELLDQVEIQLRRLAHELHPALLTDQGLQPAIEFLVDGVSARSGLTITLEGAIPRRLPASIELCFYRCVQESLTNIVRHAQARNVRIQMQAGPRELAIRVSDDGRGFDAAALATGGLGLAGMRERMRSIGGAMDLHASRGPGAALRFCVRDLDWEDA